MLRRWCTPFSTRSSATRHSRNACRRRPDVAIRRAGKRAMPKLLHFNRMPRCLPSGNSTTWIWASPMERRLLRCRTSDLDHKRLRLHLLESFHLHLPLWERLHHLDYHVMMLFRVHHERPLARLLLSVLVRRIRVLLQTCSSSPETPLPSLKISGTTSSPISYSLPTLPWLFRTPLLLNSIL